MVTELIYQEWLVMEIGIAVPGIWINECRMQYGSRYRWWRRSKMTLLWRELCPCSINPVGAIMKFSETWEEGLRDFLLGGGGWITKYDLD